MNRMAADRDSRPRVALLIETSSAHARGLIRGIAAYARTHTDWSLHVGEAGPLTTVPSWLKTWDGDGIIARLETSQIARAVAAARLPAVNVSGYPSPPGIPRVDTDNRALCQQVVDHFRERGYRHFAFVGDPRHEWSGWREAHFLEGLGARADCHVYQLRESGRRSGPELFEWLATLPRPTALFACNDACGKVVLEACELGRISVPDQIAVLGVDDDEILCMCCRPPLSSVAPDTEGIGYLAAQTLHEQLQNRAASVAERLVPPLAIRSRQSTDATAVADWHVGQALRFIHANATQNLRVDHVVAQAQTSRRFLEERFRAVVGRPIHAEIIRVRLETAQRLLTTTDLPLKTIAKRSGFRRADYLSAIFRKLLGIPPSTYRAQFGNR
jgi:LacI family transcriptional regulator